MINYISIWAKQVILSVIIATIIEMILIEKSKNTKYIKTVIGIYIMYSIISPGLKLFNKEKIDFSNIDYKKDFSDSNIYKKMEISIENTSNNSIKDTYDLNLKQDIEMKLREKGYIVSNIKLKLNMSDLNDGYGKIEKIEIKLSKKNEKNNNINIDKIKVSEEKVEEQIENKEELMQFLSKEYGVDISNITIR